MKKLLYLSHRIPYPPNKGDKIRSFNEVKYLSQRYIVDIITFADNPDDIKYKDAFKKYCRQVNVLYLNTRTAKLRGLLSLLVGQSVSQGYFYTKVFQQIFEKWVDLEEYDTLICFSSPMAEYIFKSTKDIKQIAGKLVMDFCDLDSDKWFQYSQKKRFPANLLFKLEASRLLKFEKRVNQTFDKSIFVSDKEAELFLDDFPEAKNIKVIPNGVDYNYFDSKNTIVSQKFFSPMIMFPGAMDYYGNIDGVKWFSEKILPIIKKKIPGIRFYIVGSNPDPIVKSLEKNSSIMVTGFVDDIREYYKAADLCVIPLLIARGVQNKVLESMSMGKAVVSTSQAVQGLIPGVKDVLEIENDPYEFAEKIINLIHDKKRSIQLGMAARKFVIRHYEWRKNLSAFLDTDV